MTRTVHTTVVFALVLALVAAPLAPVTGNAARGPEAPSPAVAGAQQSPESNPGHGGHALAGGPLAGTGPRPGSARLRALAASPAPAVPSPERSTGRRGTDGAGNATAANLTVGESLSGAIAAHDAELAGEVDSRAFSHRLTLATFRRNTSRAGVVAGTVARARFELALLTQRREALRAARRNGTISEGLYRVRLARLAVRARSLERLLARADAEARQLPDRTLATRGLNRTEIAVLSLRADALSDREATTLLEGIAGPGAVGPNATATPFDPVSLAGPEADLADGDPVALPDGFDAGIDGDLDIAREPAFDTNLTNETEFDTEFGTGFDTGLGTGTGFDTNLTLTDENGTNRLSDRRRSVLAVERNRSSLGALRRLLADRADGDEGAERALRCARENLADADAAISDARTALDAGDRTAVDEALARAREALTRARNCLDEARRELSDDDGDDSDGSTPTPNRDGSWSTD